MCVRGVCVCVCVCTCMCLCVFGERGLERGSACVRVQIENDCVDWDGAKPAQLGVHP